MSIAQYNESEPGKFNNDINTSAEAFVIGNRGSKFENFNPFAALDQLSFNERPSGSKLINSETIRLLYADTERSQMPRFNLLSATSVNRDCYILDLFKLLPTGIQYQVPTLKHLAMRVVIISWSSKIPSLPDDISKLQKEVFTCFFCQNLRVDKESCRCECSAPVACTSIDKLRVNPKKIESVIQIASTCFCKAIISLQKHDNDISKAVASLES